MSNDGPAPDRAGGSSGHSVVRISLHRLVQPLKNRNWRNSGVAFSEYASYVVGLTTDRGAGGYSILDAMPAFSAGWARQRANIAELAPAVLGLDPLDLGMAVQRMKRTSATPGMSAFAAVEAALHDLAAAVLGLPLHRLFGGAVRNRIDVTRMVAIGPPDEMAAHASTLAARGYRHVKVKVAGNGEDVERLKAVRAAVGPGVRLAIDANCAYATAKEAIAQFERVADLGIEIFEQPLAAHDWEGMRLLRRVLPVKIEADEAVTSLEALRRLIGMEAGDAVNLRVAEVGGLRAAHFAAKLCAEHNVGVRIAAYGSRLASAQALHLGSTLDSLHFAFDAAEFDQFEYDPFSGLEVVDGAIALPSQPGSGVGDMSSLEAEAVFD